MDKKKTREPEVKPGKSKTAKKMRDLPAKKVNAKTAKGVKGGVDFSYGTVKWTYKEQKDDGTLK